MSKMLQLFQIFSLFFNSKTHSFSQLCFLFQHFSSFRRQYPTPKLLILPVLWFSKQHTASFQVIVRRRPIFHLGNQTLMRMLTKSNFLHLSLSEHHRLRSSSSLVASDAMDGRIDGKSMIKHSSHSYPFTLWATLGNLWYVGGMKTFSSNRLGPRKKSRVSTRQELRKTHLKY